jgi:hypothetical protein
MVVAATTSFPWFSEVVLVTVVAIVVVIIFRPSRPKLARAESADSDRQLG